MKCNACGAPVENGVCTYCGKKFPLADAADAVKQEANTEEKPLTFKAKVTLIEEAAEEAKKQVDNSVKSKKRGTFWIILICLFIIGSISNAVDSYTSTKPEETATKAHVVQMTNDDGSKQNGKISVITLSDDLRYVDQEEWFFNYVLKKDYRYCLIVDPDSKPLEGTVATRYGVEKDTKLIQIGDGYYKVYDDDVKYYTADTASKTLQETYDLNTYNEKIQAKVAVAEELIPEDYKGAKYFAQMFGMEAHPQLALTLQKSDLNTDDCKALLEVIVPKLKEKIPDLTYMVVLFQKDDSTLSAIGTVDDVSAYEDTGDINFNTI